MNTLYYYTQQYLATLEFFVVMWNCCFDRPVLHTHMEPLGAVDDKREGELFCHSKENEYDRTALLTYLVADNVDHVNQDNIKGGSSFYA